MANLGAGLLQGIPVSTSLSASSLNDNAGARSAMASLTTGGIIVLTLIAFAPLFSVLPKAVLGAVIIDAVISGMIDIPEMRRLYRVKRFDFGIAVAAILGRALVRRAGGHRDRRRPVAGLAGVRHHHPASCRFSAELPGTHVFRELDAHPEDEQFPGILAAAPRRRACSSSRPTRSATGFASSVSADPPLTAVVIDCQGIDFIDSQGSAKLGELVDLTQANDVALPAGARQAGGPGGAGRDGVLDRIGADHVHLDVDQAVTAQLEHRPG